jgi:hypothetical protein
MSKSRVDDRQYVLDIGLLQQPRSIVAGIYEDYIVDDLLAAGQ